MEHLPTHHGPTTRLSRIAVFRLKQAERRREEAIWAAHRAYANEVDAIFANEQQRIAPEPRPAIANAHPWPWLVNIRAFASGLRHG